MDDNKDTEKLIIVDWDGEDDQENIKNAGILRKSFISFLLTISGCLSTSGASMWTPPAPDIQKEFDANTDTINAGLCLYVCAAAAGTLAVAPFSETFGRRPVFLISLVGFIIFQFPTAFGKNIETILVGRLLTGLFGSSFLSNAPPAVGEMFTGKKVGIYLYFNALGIFIGPAVGPIVSGFSVLEGSRWPFYVYIMWSGAVCILSFFFVSETYPPILLKHKAQKLRKVHNSDIYKAPCELEYEDDNLGAALVRSLKRPAKLFLLDPMMTFLCVYTGFLLSVLYFFCIAFPEVFRNIYGFNMQEVGLSFIGILIGMVLSGLFVPMWESIRINKIKKNNGIEEPEFRLTQMCAGSVFAPIGLFMFAWTIYSSIHWIVPLTATAIFGAGSFWTCNSIVSYTVVAYKQYSASAVAANAFIRCTMAGIFPMFAKYMLYGMGGGYHWPLSFIGFIALLLMPSSFILKKYGKTLRSKSKFAV